jgi:hypothetical protein
VHNEETMTRLVGVLWQIAIEAEERGILGVGVV